jgi:hypothetical protein
VIIHEIGLPAKKQNKGLIAQRWSQFVNLANDVGLVAGAITAVSRLLGI